MKEIYEKFDRLLLYIVQINCLFLKFASLIMSITPQISIELATTVIRWSSLTTEQDRSYQAVFGVTPQICSSVWNLIKSIVTNNCSSQHLLWILTFLMGYQTEDFNSALISTDPKTFRKWGSIIVEAIASQRLVRFISMFLNFYCFIFNGHQLF